MPQKKREQKAQVWSSGFRLHGLSAGQSASDCTAWRERGCAKPRSSDIFRRMGFSADSDVLPERAIDNSRALPTVRVLVSSCLLGESVRYDGSHARADNTILERWKVERRLVPFCPELAGGFSVPRSPAEIQGEGGLAVVRGEAIVVEKAGRDVTACFVLGAHRALQAARCDNVKLAILKDGSPSCGSTYIGNGSFKGLKRAGQGVTAALLEQQGIRVFSERQIKEAAAYLAQLEAAGAGGKPGDS